MKSIVLFTSEFPYGTQETFLENEIGFLAGSFETVIVVPLFKSNKVRELNFKNVEVLTPVNNSRAITLHKFSLLLDYNFWKTFINGAFEIEMNAHNLIKLSKQALIVSRLNRYLKKRKLLFEKDLWYFYWGTNSVNVLTLLKSFPPTAVRYHGYDLYKDDLRVKGAQVFQRQVCQVIDKAYFVSEHGRRYAVKKLGFEEVKTETVRLGVPDRGSCSSSRDGKLRLLSISNIYEVKRVHLIAQALELVDDIEIEWTHIGDGPLREKRKIFDKIEGFKNNVKANLIGRLDNASTMEYLRQNSFDLFLNVSSSEGIPVSIMEALSFGVPVMATDVGGTSEIANTRHGFLLDPNITPEELANEIRGFYSKDYQNVELREIAKSNWSTFANSDSNYGAFVRSLKLIKKEKKKKSLLLVSNVEANWIERDFDILSKDLYVDRLKIKSIRSLLTKKVLTSIYSADSMMIWFGSLMFLPLVVLARLLNKPIIMVSGGYEVAKVSEMSYGAFTENILSIIFRKTMFKLVDKVACVSYSNLEDTIKNGGFNPKDCSVIYHGFKKPSKVSTWEQRDNKIVMLSRANIEIFNLKGINFFLDIASELPEYSFELLGETDPEVKSIISGRNIKNLTIEGFIPHGSVEFEQKLNSSKVVLMLSAYESFGCAVIDATLRGCYPISFDSYAQKEVVEGIGTVVPYGNVDQVVNEIKEVIKGDIKAKDLAYLAYTKFPIEKRSEDLKKLVEGTIGNQSGH